MATSFLRAAAHFSAPPALHPFPQRPQSLLLCSVYFLAFLTVLLSPVTADRAQHIDANAHTNPKAVVLLPEHPRRGERLVCGATRLYHVRDLRLDAVYDVKLSYPATVPTEFDLEVRHVLAVHVQGAAATVDGPRRRVLNTAKLRLRPREILLRSTRSEQEDALETFPLDPATLVDGASPGDAVLSLELAVRGRVEGVSRVLDLENRECMFDIVVEELVLGGQVPRASLALIAWLVIALALAARVVFPFLTAKIALERPEDKSEDDHKQS